MDDRLKEVSDGMKECRGPSGDKLLLTRNIGNHLREAAPAV